MTERGLFCRQADAFLAGNTLARNLETTTEVSFHTFAENE